MDNCADTQNDIGWENISQHDQYCKRMVFTSTPYPSMCPLMLYIFIDYLGGIALFVHDKTCDISAVLTFGLLRQYSV